MSPTGSPLASAAFGLTLGLVAVAIHSLSDFGQHTPAVFALTALTSALVVNIARLERRSSGPRRRRRGRPRPTASARNPIAADAAAEAAARGGSGKPRGVRRTPAPRTVRVAAAAATAGLSLAWSWALVGAAGAYRAEQYAAAGLSLEDAWRAERPLTDEDYADLLWAAEGAVAHDPRNPRHAYRLNALRWESMSRERHPETGRVLLPRDALPLVERIADALAEARCLAPTYGPPHALEGSLRLWVLGQDAGAALIANGYRLAPYDGRVCLAAAELRARQGDADAAAEVLARAVAIDPSQYEAACEICLAPLERPALAMQLAAGNAARLRWLAARLRSDPRWATEATGVEQRAEQALRASVAQGDANPREIAALAARDAERGAVEEAVEGYRTALRREYAQAGWHLELARLLVGLERYAEAVREARICLRLKPGLKGAEEIVAEHGR